MPRKQSLRLLAIALLAHGTMLYASLGSAAASVVKGTIGQQLDEYLLRLEALGFSGTVLVAKQDRLILHKGYGWTDRERKLRYGPDTVVDIGAITKQFTAAAILKLEMQGKLSLNDPISKFFDAVPADKQATTLHHLLSHSSGLPPEVSAPEEKLTRDALVAKALAAKLRSPPGARGGYSNAGYALLGVVIEKVSGQSYETFLQQELFGPAGMTRTGYRVPRWNPLELAQGYRIDAPFGTPLDQPWAPDGPWWNLRASDSLLSTLSDLYKWHQALQGERILSAAAKDKASTGYSGADAREKYLFGYGWVVTTTPRGTPQVGHTGSSNRVFTADLQRYLDEDTVIISASSASDFPSVLFTHQIAGVLFDGAKPVAPVAAQLAADALASFAGTYQFSNGGKVTVSPAVVGPLGALGLAVVPTSREAFEVVMGSISPDQRAQLGTLETRLVSALQASLRGEFEPIAALGSTRVASVEQSIPARIYPWESRLGEIQRFELLGSFARGSRLSSWVRFVYEKGGLLYEHDWQDQRIAASRPVEGLGGTYHVEASRNALFTFHAPSHTVQRIYLERNAQGAVSALLLQGPTGEVRADRQAVDPSESQP